MAVRLLRVCSSFLLVGFLAMPAAGQVDPELLAGLEARSIGPAGMSGRIAAVEGIAGDPDVIYVGAATGGLWRSNDGGLTWEPLFDDQPVAAIGAVSVHPHNPDIVWVGTGEGNTRNSVSVGNGVYRSLDGGRTWTHLGLERSERIHRILLHPSNPDLAYVAAVGPLWGEGEERGVFRTRDGGETWERVLFVNPRTGAADLIMDPRNPDKLIAAMWEHRRWPWFFDSGGPGSGLYLTVDGGETWKELTPADGLPKGDLGRIGLAFAPSEPETIYALVEAKVNQFLRSEDGGYTWKSVNRAGENMGNRPFYYADIRVDPERPNRVYSLWSLVSVSEDGGESFEVLVPFRDVHPDHHAMWIDPTDGSRIIEGNDGGVYISQDRGATWRFVSNLPLAQYYHIAVDTLTPYNVYGGMQDNGSWRGPAEVWENGGIRNHHWEEVGFGDGFATLPIPSDPMTGYSESQEGFLRRWDLRTGERKDIRPAPPSDTVELRFNWNAAIAVDPFDPNTVYFGSQFVHRSTDRGETWTILSPDLTTDNPEWQRQAESGGLTPDVTGAENFTSIITIAPSALEPGVLWVGTDDGRVHVTRDGGASWTSVEDNLDDVPENTWVPQIEPSKFDPAAAFIVLDDHRRSNWTPYVYATTDYGRSWRSLVTDEVRGYALTITQDPVKPELLYLGTEFGLWVSLNRGRNWMKWTHGFPTVGVRELAVQPKEHDLVIGTHGRSAYVIDDIRPLRTISTEVLQRPIHLFEIGDAQQYRVKQTGASRFPGHTEFRGTNEPYGAILTYSLNVEGLPHPNEEVERERQADAEAEASAEATEEGEADGGSDGRAEDEEPKATVEIRDASGDVIRTFQAPARMGVVRAVWDLRRDAFERPPRDEPSFFDSGGPEVLPGTYGVTVRYGEHEATGEVTVLPDPRFDIPRADREAKFAARMRAGRLQEAVVAGIERVRRTRDDIDVILDRAKSRADTMNGEMSGATPALVDSAKALKATLDDLERRLWVPPDTKGIVAETDVLSRVQYVQRSLGSSWDAPTPAQQEYLGRAEEQVRGAIDALNRVYAEDVERFRGQVRRAGIELLEPVKPLEVPTRGSP